MKKYIKYSLIILMLSIFIAPALHSQSVKILKVDPTAYPKMRAEFEVKNSGGAEVRYPDYTNVLLFENGKNIPCSLYCAPPGRTKMSIIFTIDRSQSMDTLVIGSKTDKRMDVVKRVARKVILKLPDPKRWEAAVTSFDNWAEIETTAKNTNLYTNDRDELIKRVGNIMPRGGTDYNSGFLYDVRKPPQDGDLLVARKAQYKPVVIFMTDGNHNGPPAPAPSRTLVWTDQIIKEAMDVTMKVSKTPATIFALALGLAVPQSLKDITKATPLGEAFAADYNEDALVDLIISVIDKIGTIATQSPCEVYWDATCTSGGMLNLSVPGYGDDSTMYSIPDSVKPYLSVSPTRKSFPLVNNGASKIDSITITAKNNYVVLNGPGYNSPNGKFTIIDWGKTPTKFPDTLLKGESRTVKIKYLASDTAFNFSDITFNSNACTTDPLKAYAGWVHVKPFHCGSQKINSSKNISDVVFCNNTGDAVVISKLNISGLNASEFKYISPAFPVTVKHDSCVTFTFSFTPKDIDTRTAFYEVETNLGKFKEVLDGNGTGDPEIEVQHGTFPRAKCKTPIVDINVDVYNPGALPLTIQSAKINGGPNPTDFQDPDITGIQPIPPGEKHTLVVKFQPQGAAGQKQAILTILSNAGQRPKLDTILIAFKDSTGFISSVLKLDFGIICPNELKSLTLKLTNTGNVDNSISASASSPYNLPVRSWTLTPSAQQDVTVELQSAAEGIYNTTLTFTDDCNNPLTVQLTGRVEIPRINDISIRVDTTFGNSKDTTFKVCNQTNAPIKIDSAVAKSADFKLINPPLPWTIQPGACIDVTVEYTARTNNVINSIITLYGTPCSFKDSINVMGNPAMATADLAIDNLSGYVGQNVQVPINMRNPYQVAQSGATSLTTELSYDPQILEYVSTNPPVTANAMSGVLSLSGVGLNGGVAGTLVTITFKVLPSTKTSSPLNLSNSKSVGGQVVFNEIDGVFTLNIASATLTIGSCSAAPGQEFTCPITMTNINNITNFNVSISTELNFDATLLEPLDKNITDLGITGGIRTIRYLDLPVTPENSGVLFSPKFKAMLGSSKSTDLKIANTKVATGQANFTEAAGRFELLNICENGGTRLFDPFGNAAILFATPNPGSGNLQIFYGTEEEGFAQLVLTDLLGSRKMVLFNGSVKAGIHETNLDATSLPNGKYLIILTTQGKTLTKWLDVIK